MIDINKLTRNKTFPMHITSFRSQTVNGDVITVEHAQVMVNGVIVGVVDKMNLSAKALEKLFQVEKKEEMSGSGYKPDSISRPGETIEELMGQKRWSASQLGGKLGLGEITVQRLIKGRVKITDDLADKLGEVFGTDANFWRTREKNYREWETEKLKKQNEQKFRKSTR